MRSLNAADIATRSKNGRIDMDSLLDVLTVLMTRNFSDPVQRSLNNIQFKKNMHNLNTHPEHHMIFVMSNIDKAAQKNKAPTFEDGLMLGCSAALASRAPETRQLLARIVKGVIDQQKIQDEDFETKKKLEAEQVRFADDLAPVPVQSVQSKLVEDMFPII